ncbi:MAG: hypothetical protein JKY56_27605 [Kofleriaceae bacterium]|nr:hypothetical protein [Kofleriaceae bacterium]
MRSAVTLLACLPLLSCGSDEQDSGAELPVAKSWTGSEVAVQPVGKHQGLDIGLPDDPHAGLGLDMGAGSDPHAGLGLGLGGDSDPHAGLDLGMGSVAGLGLKAPDPDRQVDDSQFLSGSLSIAAELKNAVSDGVLFLSVRPVNKLTGESLGSPLAVEILDLSSFPIEFRLSGAQTMVAGTEFVGDVLIYARIDQDREASTSTPGDVEGSVRATIPASGLRLVLDTLVP